jgi:hypothetical protein
MPTDSAIFQGEWIGSSVVKECRIKARICGTDIYRNERMIKLIFKNVQDEI